MVMGTGVAACAPVDPPLPKASGTQSFQRLPVFAQKTDSYAQVWDKSITSEQFGSPAVGDVSGDGKPDVVAGYPDGTVYVWDATTGARLYKRYVGPGAVQSSPNLVDLNGDGRLDILVATTNGPSPKTTGGNVVAFDLTGKTLFSKRTGDGVHPAGNFATPQAADIDHDGKLEVIETSWDHHLHVWKQSGAELPGFPFFVKDTIWSSPAVADLDGDGWLDIVFGYDCDGVAGQDCYNGTTYGRRGGYVTAVNHLGKTLRGWPRFYNGQVIWSSPALADLDGDGHLDVVVGTGNMSGTNLNGGHQLLAYRADGTYLPGFPANVGGKVMGSPALGDVNGDGKLEIVFVADDGRLYVLDRAGHTLWSRCTANDMVSCPRVLHSTPSIADVNGDGKQEIVVGSEQHLAILNGSGTLLDQGKQGPGDIGANFLFYVKNADGSIEKSVPFVAAPTVAQVNGRTMIYVAAGAPMASGSFGRIWGWTTGKPLGASAWPTFRQNSGRTGSADRVAPERAVYPLTPKPNAGLGVTFYGKDAGVGVSGLDVQVSDNGGAWKRWKLTAPTYRGGDFASAGGTFVGTPGHTYAFRVQAWDRVGNTSAWSAPVSAKVS
jgi:hypothetical protein